ncbi:MAG: D-alanyl-D-alanine carboxypeptidase/D-alanyl-D-alanine-endopeptidase [Phormidesmis sp. RL_2_1]|nr:D-alanyl-D-alanine carboxypeptidase/D-alanyl-D-alanine-endopeptidase [Phormidesmis sp. RL_2_1]
MQLGLIQRSAQRFTTIKVILSVGSVLLLWSTTRAAVAQGVCAAQVAEQIDAIAARPELSQGRLGIRVEMQGQTEAEQTVIISRDADQFFIPASNIKLLTTAAALQQLGPDFRVRTSVYGQTHNGLTSLYVVGRGDPTLTNAHLQDLAQQLAGQGITRVDHLFGYDRYFPGRAYHPNWEWEDVQAGYGAPINSLILNQNALELALYPSEVGQPLRVEWDDPSQKNRWQIENFSQTVAAGEPSYADVGQDQLGQPRLQVFGVLSADYGADPFSIAIANPGEYFLQQFSQSLNEQNMTIAQSALLSEPWPQSAPELASITSPPLSAWLPFINGDSNNLYAGALLKALGIAHGAGNNFTDDATVVGTKAVKNILEQLGVDPSTYEMVDGSGLSRHNLATPQTFIDVLQAMAYHPYAAHYRNSLAVAGEQANLRRRFQNTVVQGQLQGKTGYVRNNESLSGYFDLPHHPPVVFSIMMSNVNQPARVMRGVVDEIVLALAQLQPC